MDYEKVTVQDCMDMKEKRGQEVLINDGNVEGFFDGRMKESLEKRMITDWIDGFVQLHQRLRSMKKFDENIEAYADNNIVIYEGIERISDALGVPLNEHEIPADSDCRYPYKYTFLYKGTELLQLTKERIHPLIPCRKENAL